MDKHDWTIIHLVIYKDLKKVSNGRTMISWDSIREVLRRRIPQVPRNFHYPILKEMVKFKLVKRINKSNYQLIAKDIDKNLDIHSPII